MRKKIEKETDSEKIELLTYEIAEQKMNFLQHRKNNYASDIAKVMSLPFIAFLAFMSMAGVRIAEIFESIKEPKYMEDGSGTKIRYF